VDYEDIACDLVEHFVWEPAQESASKLVHRHGPHFGMAAGEKYARLKSAQEVLAESWLPLLIPIIGLQDFVVGFGREDDALNHAAPEPFV
jgi:hypothetical protein